MDASVGVFVRGKKYSTSTLFTPPSISLQLQMYSDIGLHEQNGEADLITLAVPVV